MTEALAERPALSGEQLDLIRRTVAKDATKDELALFLYDCQRRGIHPLDKLLHFTKRGGRYTPVTSIDFMRSQAAMSGEMAGSDDAVFDFAGDHLSTATVTVYRMTAGQRFAYTATARWSEYCPDNAPMWKRMPHTMLGKCAEALALRKAFPQQLAGLYSREEMDQADGPQGFVVTPPAHPAPAIPPSVEERENGVGRAVETIGPSSEVDLVADLPEGLRILRVEHKPTANKNVTKHTLVLSDGREVTTIKEQLAALADELCQLQVIVSIDTKSTKWGENLEALQRAEDVNKALDAEICADIDLKDLPF